MKKIVWFLLAAFLFSQQAWAHSGRTDKEGCHMDRKSGTRHCH